MQYLEPEYGAVGVELADGVDGQVAAAVVHAHAAAQIASAFIVAWGAVVAGGIEIVVHDFGHAGARAGVAGVVIGDADACGRIGLKRRGCAGTIEFSKLAGVVSVVVGAFAGEALFQFGKFDLAGVEPRLLCG